MLQYFPTSVVGTGGGSGGVGGGLGLQEDLRAMAGVAALEGPQLALVRQTSSVVERVSRNGLQKNVHVVVKACPFALHLALAQPPRPASAPDAPPPLSLKYDPPLASTLLCFVVVVVVVMAGGLVGSRCAAPLSLRSKACVVWHVVLVGGWAGGGRLAVRAHRGT
jgi:hypothetical protein